MTSVIYRPITSAHDAAQAVAEPIIKNLRDNKRVLWLVPGGSGTQVATDAATYLADENTKNLAITLTDERFGPVGHRDSNWQQLRDSNFQFHDANQLPVLINKDLATTAREFEQTLKEATDSADIIIGLFGIGTDAHTAGILPHSEALQSPNLVHAYQTPTFTRITITPHVMPHIDIAFVYAFGEEKWPVVQKLKDEHNVADQPMQALKQAKEVIVLTDYQ